MIRSRYVLVQLDIESESDEEVNEIIEEMDMKFEFLAGKQNLIVKAEKVEVLPVEA